MIKIVDIVKVENLLFFFLVVFSVRNFFYFVLSNNSSRGTVRVLFATGNVCCTRRSEQYYDKKKKLEIVVNSLQKLKRENVSYPLESPRLNSRLFSTRSTRRVDKSVSRQHQRPNRLKRKSRIDIGVVNNYYVWITNALFPSLSRCVPPQRKLAFFGASSPCTWINSRSARRITRSRRPFKEIRFPAQHVRRSR